MNTNPPRHPTRRQFLQTTAAAGLVAAAAAPASADQSPAPASERLRVGMIGIGGRGMGLLSDLLSSREIDVVAVSDLDPKRLSAAAGHVADVKNNRPAEAADFRKVIDDPKVDAVVLGTPDHWHAIPTILACQAGKDVYVEKPDGHNIVEGQRMVAAMRKHGRVVQLGTQSRSSRHMLTAMEFIRSGKLGRCLVAKAWESTRQGSLGHPPDEPTPPGVDYDTWLGPAPKRPFNRLRFHGNWRWFFDYGTGDLGNDGVHRLDVARWALSTAAEREGDPPLMLPKTVSVAGGKWYFDDAQEWPDTMQVTYEYPPPGAGKPGRLLTYEMRVWNPYDYLGEGEGAALFGDEGYIIIANERWRAYGNGGELIAEDKGSVYSPAHVQSFVDAVKNRTKPSADLETVGHPSSVLCHAGNVAWRVGRKLTIDAETETFVGDAEANALRTRPEYRAPWVLPEV